MRIYATGEGQDINQPGEFMEEGYFGQVIGIADIGSNNSKNDFGWTGVKAIIHLHGANYILDFPQNVRLETDDGVTFLETSAGDLHHWHPTVSDCDRYGLWLFNLQG